MTPDIARERDSVLARIGNVLDAERLARHLSVSEFARRSGLSKRGVIYGRKCMSNPRLATLIAQFDALGLRLVVSVEPKAAASAGASNE